VFEVSIATARVDQEEFGFVNECFMAFVIVEPLFGAVFVVEWSAVPTQHRVDVVNFNSMRTNGAYKAVKVGVVNLRVLLEERVHLIGLLVVVEDSTVKPSLSKATRKFSSSLARSGSGSSNSKSVL
jgi:hypothetical protein